MNAIAIIPARGGSKRIPRKNIIEFKGKPIIAWTIEAALDSGLFEDVLVSTDEHEIASVSINYGAKVPFYRDQAFDDQSPVSQATLHSLIQMESYTGKSYDAVVQLMPNCPLRDSELIVELFNEYQKHPGYSLISAFSYGMFNPWWAHKLDDKKHAYPVFGEEVRNMRSQDQEKLYCPTGAVWISDANKLREYETFYSDGYRFFPISWVSGLDIDDYEDLKLAQITYDYKDQK